MNNNGRNRQDTIDLLKHYSAFILLAIMLILNLIITSNFASMSTVRNIISQTCTIILTGMGMTAVISTGGIDISVGSVMALGGVVSAMLLNKIGVIPAVIVAVLICLISGAIAGFMVGTLRVQAMVVTLALMMGVRGVAQLMNDGKIYYINDTNNISESTIASFKQIGSGQIFGLIPVQVVPIIISVAIAWFLLEKTILGRHIQAVGDNPRSATLAGISAPRTLLFVYMFSAACAGFAGVITASKAGAADANTLGNLAELDAIAAVAVGGTSMAGGRAKVFGTVVGALIMQLINITVNMNNITYEYAQILKAIIIVLAVYIQREKNS